MFYLAVLVLVAAAGILKLWVIQRRERADAGAIDAYRDSLRRLGSSPMGGSATPRGPVTPSFSRGSEGSDDGRGATARRRATVSS